MHAMQETVSLLQQSTVTTTTICKSTEKMQQTKCTIVQIKITTNSQTRH